ncbi:protein-disulfide isomerase [Nocardioides daedukensis]|uniref:Protein-disulfide isomerase n=1 Tax=Nocardioides daedukensis TaxID=634462 RepID=A0A7Y9S3P3_9ACTN|nr:thioredoxin domain-containing protein [Nocardioides daedukensis]NYG60766.1 protein-disulfide isomerase [Nocardioides daedukensis]
MSGSRPGKKKKPIRKPVDAEAVAAKRERRAKATAERLERERRSRRTRVIKQVGIVAVVGAAAIGLTIAIIKGTTPDFAAAPPGFDEDGDTTIGNTAAPVTVTVIEDLSCPRCKSAHAENKDLLARYAKGDDVRVDYRPVAFLDEHSTNEYSTRALNAAACVVEDDPSNWSAMHGILLVSQPDRGKDGPDDGELVDFAAEAGADSDATRKCIDDRKHEDWIDWTTHKVTKDPDFGGTPAISVNGKLVDPNPGAIDAAVQAALAK